MILFLLCFFFLLFGFSLFICYLFNFFSLCLPHCSQPLTGTDISSSTICLFLDFPLLQTLFQSASTRKGPGCWKSYWVLGLAGSAGFHGRYGREARNLWWKRVNVGLEMVMEPSLLILDEPTSGLDSSSSNLLLRALRREALEGVNICMVVHQPR